MRPASFLQPLPRVTPPQELQPQTPTPRAASERASSLFGSVRADRSALTGARRGRAEVPNADIIFGSEATLRLSTDVGSLLGESQGVLGVPVQRRTPVVSEPRIHSSRVGRTAAAGSYWVPARLDLDTMVSKLDSRIIEDLIVIKGPYSVLYGPGFSFLDVDLKDAPRYAEGLEIHGSTSADYRANGRQIYGRQDAWGGASDWGFRVGYGHRTGNDYRSGHGTHVPASYNSRDVDLTLGFDLTPESSVEFTYLRLDQTGMEFPGQAFDIDVLMTNGFDLEYSLRDQPYYDRLTVTAWYNDTRLHGNAQGAGKRRQFPFYDLIGFSGFTDVTSSSSGFRAALMWGQPDQTLLTIGTDLRYVQQGLNEITSGSYGLASWQDANSPIPGSYQANPGVFAELSQPLSDACRVKAGTRADLVQSDITDDPAKLAQVGTEQLPLAAVLGSDAYSQSHSLVMAYLSGEYDINCCWQVKAGGGYAQRAPSLTELYAAQPFMFLLQNGLNTVTGDPRLNPEQIWQVDLGLHYDDGWLRGGVHGFHAWCLDYITFENLRIFRAPPFGQVEQVSLKFVNTDLATFVGGDAFCECDWTNWCTAFATVHYVDGRDRTRNGDFATRRATAGQPSVRVPGLARGYFSGVAGAADEPLPSISPLESRLGLRFHSVQAARNWLVELGARIVADQNRVATSLLESPTTGFTVWDLRGVWRVTPSLQLVAGIENLTDTNYRESLDYRSPDGIQMFQPGRNIYGGITLTY
jgi:outer membrane receptor protein involved in Fe transport